MVTTNTSKLYDTDFNLWLESTAKLLRERKFDQLDLDNLVEEIEALAKRDKRELESWFEVLLAHLLKWQYQPQKRTNSWRLTLLEQRRRLERLLQDSPSLKPYLQECLAECYGQARKAAELETQSRALFPAECPYSPEQALAHSFFPGEPDDWAGE